MTCTNNNFWGSCGNEYLFGYKPITGLVSYNGIQWKKFSCVSHSCESLYTLLYIKLYHRSYQLPKNCVMRVPISLSDEHEKNCMVLLCLLWIITLWMETNCFLYMDWENSSMPSWSLWLVSSGSRKVPFPIDLV